LAEKVIVARESLVLGNNFSLFEENSWLFDDNNQLFRSRLFFLGQALSINILSFSKNYIANLVTNCTFAIY